MFSFHQTPEPTPEPPRGHSPEAPGSPPADRRTFLQHDRGWRTVGGCILVATGLAIALIPWIMREGDGRGWEFSVPFGAAIWVYAALLGLYRGTTVIDREERTVTYRWGWLGWTAGASATPLDQFRGIALTRHSSRNLSRHYRVQLVGPSDNRPLYSSMDYEQARAQALGIAEWAGLRVVSTASA
jgi:hypothetical protein